MISFSRDASEMGIEVDGLSIKGDCVVSEHVPHNRFLRARAQVVFGDRRQSVLRTGVVDQGFNR
jgi:hypothetical protein